jgi:photosystem II stability/assembly factor-like uncharacterized protein
MTRQRATRSLSIKRRSTQKVRTLLLSGLLVAAALIAPVQTIFAANPTYEWSRNGLTTILDRSWSDVASSTDGTKLIASAYSDMIYTSTDSGASWTPREPGGSNYWNSVASSADGTKLVAVSDRGYIYTSTNSGVTWTARATDTERDWYSVASSADGTKLVAAAGYDYIYTSTDSGVTWIAQESSGMRSWTAVVTSTDGAKIAAAVDSGERDEEGMDIGGYVYTFTEGDEEWIQQGAPHKWKSLAASADLGKLVGGTSQDGAYTFTDGGENWVAIDEATDPEISWWTATVSNDGSKMVVAGNDSHLLVSTNGGSSWEDRTEIGRDWAAVTYSPDGTVLIGGVSNAAYIRISTNDAMTWSDAAVNGTGAWVQVLTSNDGTVVVAADLYGKIYRSTNSGDTWAQLVNGGMPLSYLSMSADGSKLLAAGESDVYTSINGGTTWVARAVANVVAPSGTAMSADGLKMVIVEYGGSTHVSNDGGATWTERVVDNVSWRQVVSSADGRMLLAMPNNGSLYRSGDGGETWSPLPLSTDVSWGRVAMSADGLTMMAFDYATNLLYVSTNGGDEWTPQTTVGQHFWSAISLSADGHTLIATTYQDQGIWISSDTGATWVLQEISGASDKWSNVTSSAHGVKIFAVQATGWLYKATIPGALEEHTPPDNETPSEEPPVVQTPPATIPSTSSSGNSSAGTTIPQPSMTSGQTDTTADVNEQSTINLMDASAFRTGDDYKIEVIAGQVMMFEVENAAHTMTIDSVQGGSVTFTLRSTPQTHTLRIGETGKYDVDGDKTDDVSVTVNDIVNGTATLTLVNLLATKVSVLSMPQDEANDTSDTASKPAMNYALIAWVAGGVIALLITIMIIRKAKRA